MPHVVEWFEDGVPVQAWFEQRGAELPLRLRDGTVHRVTWGACALRFPLGESDNEPGHLTRWPDTGWVPLDAIRAGEWYKFEPQPVKICAARFCVVGPMSVPRWHKLQRGQYLQGLLATLRQQWRVYVVTVPAPDGVDTALDVWPRIVGVNVPDRHPPVPRPHQ